MLHEQMHPGRAELQGQKAQHENDACEPQDRRRKGERTVPKTRLDLQHITHPLSGCQPSFRTCQMVTATLLYHGLNYMAQGGDLF